ncbi:MAG: Rpn family recombination-promoting nuclease/putative transposase [Bacteroidota bacterium]
MSELKEKYINPFTDFGFKKIFGEEPNKDLLIDFLNELLRQNEGEITELTYSKNDKTGSLASDRSAIFDLYCINQDGERFIVEMQKTEQAFFKERALYYSTFPIQEQAQKGEWNFELKAVYTIGILNFSFNEDEDDDKIRHEVKLTDIDTKEVFYDKFTFIYLTMDKFNKKAHELETKFEKWLYLLKNLHKLERLPDELKEDVFEKVAEVAMVANLTREQFNEYQKSVKVYRDLNNVLDHSYSKGVEKGGNQKEIAFVLRLYEKGKSVEEIADLIGLPVDRAEQILKGL